MAQAPRHKLPEHLKCAVCWDVYKSPRILPCFHSFCVECLDGVARTADSQTFLCPTCRRPVEVPERGVQEFTLNFHISEEDLEKEKYLASRLMCESHPSEELLHFCKECDLAVCLSCTQTRHEHHETEDISQTAERCRKKLMASRKKVAKTWQKLIDISAALKDNHQAAIQKAELFTNEVQEHYTSLITMVTDQRDNTLDALTVLTDDIDENFSTHISSIQQRHDSLQQLQQQIDLGIDSKTTAEVLKVEKEVRKGMGIMGKLVEMADLQRLGLEGGMPVLRLQDDTRLFGRPVCLQLPANSPTKDIKISEVYRCEEVNGCREIHALQKGCYMSIAYGGSPPSYEGERVIRIDVRRASAIEPATLVKKKVNFKGCMRYAKTIMSKRCSAEQIIYSKSESNTRIVWHSHKSKAVLRSSPKAKKHAEKDEIVFQLEGCFTPLAMDSNASEHRNLFIVLSEEVSSARSDSTMTAPSSPAVTVTSYPHTASSPRRLVQMYLPKQTKPVSQYTPPSQPFFPTDVCFYHSMFPGTHRPPVLISDLAMDAIHIVSVENREFRFLRYLANGSPQILRPTALDSWKDFVYIGCRNGLVLRCECNGIANSGHRTEEEVEEKEENDDDEGEEEDSE